LFVLGIVLFSGLIYLRVLTGFVGLNRFIPVGGTLLMLAWLMLLPAAWRVAHLKSACL
jgi:uncharacterized membrane protein YgdD (TMEM256/DUF423 family)